MKSEPSGHGAEESWPKGPHRALVATCPSTALRSCAGGGSLKERRSAVVECKGIGLLRAKMAAGGPSLKRSIHNLSQHSAILTTNFIATYWSSATYHYIPSSIFPSSLCGTWPTRQAPRPLLAKDLSRFASGVPTCVALGWSWAEQSPCFSRALERTVKFSSCFATDSCHWFILLECCHVKVMSGCKSVSQWQWEPSAIHHVQ